MAAELVPGPIAWSGSEDVEGYRTYKVTHRVNVESTDGPQVAMDCPDLPQVGDIWAFGSDLDQWAWCLPEKTCEMSGQPKEGYPNLQFKVTQTFSAKPPPTNRQRCNDIKIEDPLLEPLKIRVSTTQDKEEASYDRFGRYITNSAWEQLRGPQVEFNKSAMKVRFEINVPAHNLSIWAAARDTVNALPMWGMPPRTILLSSVDLDRKFLGRCEEYWTLIVEFEVRAESWDRSLMDEGTKALNGHWHDTEDRWVLDEIEGTDPDPLNPAHFKRFKDRDGECARVLLNGRGVPATVVGLFPVDEQALPLRAFTYNVGDFVSHGGLNYVCIRRNTGVEPVDVNQDVAPFNTTWVLSGDTPPFGDLWDLGTTYFRGSIVQVEFVNGGGLTQVYVALDTNVGKNPGAFGNEGVWRLLPNGATDLGPWIGLSNNNIYDPVDANNEPTGVGEVFVAKYGETDFLLLGIPAIF